MIFTDNGIMFFPTRNRYENLFIKKERNRYGGLYKYVLLFVSNI